MDCASWHAKIMWVMETNELCILARLDKVAYANQWTVYLGLLR